MERAERFIVLGVGLLFAELLVRCLWVMLGLRCSRSVQRFVKVWRQGDRPASSRTRTAAPDRPRPGPWRSAADQLAPTATQRRLTVFGQPPCTRGFAG